MADDQAEGAVVNHEAIQLTRHLGKGTTVDVAPQHAKMAVDYLAHPGAYLRVEDGDIVIADQVVYRITGYDPTDCTLTLKLVQDWRPGQKDDPNRTKATHG